MYTKTEAKRLNYLVKVVIPNKNSVFRVKKIRHGTRCTSVEEMKRILEAQLPCVVPIFTTAGFGYVEPGHGAKGRQR